MVEVQIGNNTDFFGKRPQQAESAQKGGSLLPAFH